MNRILLCMLIVFLLLPMSCSYGSSEQAKDSPQSLDLSIDEASTLLKDLDTNIKVIEIRKSSIEGLWEVAIESGKRKGLVYIDSSKKHLITGAIISLKEKKNLTEERLTELNKVDVSAIPLDDALVMGNKNAKYRVVVFDDPE